MANITNNSLDLDINFDRNPLSGDVAVRRGEEAIKRALRNLILFGPNEKPFHPEINSGIRSLLFELTDPVTIMELKTRISEIIKKYEPRVDAAMIDLADVIDRNEVRITIRFTIKNVKNVFATTVAMKRIR
jgi:phage baseplate assembly protein W